MHSLHSSLKFCKFDSTGLVSFSVLLAQVKYAKTQIILMRWWRWLSKFVSIPINNRLI